MGFQNISVIKDADSLWIRLGTPTSNMLNSEVFWHKIKYRAANESLVHAKIHIPLAGILYIISIKNISSSAYYCSIKLIFYTFD